MERKEFKIELPANQGNYEIFTERAMADMVHKCIGKPFTLEFGEKIGTCFDYEIKDGKTFLKVYVDKEEWCDILESNSKESNFYEKGS